jgi:hypothetical protein
MQTDREAFLDGHSFGVTCIAISTDGKTMASGQANMVAVKVSNVISKKCNLFLIIIYFRLRLSFGTLMLLSDWAMQVRS